MESAAACLAVLLSAAGGILALRYAELASETPRALRVGVTRARFAATIERLRRERSELHDAIEAMAQGIALPGRITAGGSIGD